MDTNKIIAKITGIRYTPFLCRELTTFDLESLHSALSTQATFILNITKTNSAAISWWVSSKRTRSYPYTRVYDSLSFSGRKITIIPIMKDEGLEGDRDFLQWDTISLMSLLGIYVIIGYYIQAEPSTRYRNKITNQRFDIDYLKAQINSIMSYQSDALHWNLEHVSNAGTIAQKAVTSYEIISRQSNVEMHSLDSANKRIAELLKGKDNFLEFSRMRAKQAQFRETNTIQPKEYLSGSKASITISNYLGGYYYLTADECEIKGTYLYLTEGKHSDKPSLPSLADIKDGLLKMILFCNLKDVTLNGVSYTPKPVLKLTFNGIFDPNQLSKHYSQILNVLNTEAITNSFEIKINQ